MTSNMKSASCWVMHMGGLILNTLPSKPPLPINRPRSFILSNACSVSSFAGACTPEYNPLDKCNVSLAVTRMLQCQYEKKAFLDTLLEKSLAQQTVLATCSCLDAAKAEIQETRQQAPRQHDCIIYQPCNTDEALSFSIILQPTAAYSSFDYSFSLRGVSRRASQLVNFGRDYSQFQ